VQHPVQQHLPQHEIQKGDLSGYEQFCPLEYNGLQSVESQPTFRKKKYVASIVSVKE
jgi:hypothetical protein